MWSPQMNTEHWTSFIVHGNIWWVFSQPMLRLVTVNNTIVYTHIDSSLKLQYIDIILKDMTYYIWGDCLERL